MNNFLENYIFRYTSQEIYIYICAAPKSPVQFLPEVARGPMVVSFAAAPGQV